MTAAIFPYGERALLVRLGQTIDPAVSEQVLALASQLQALWQSEPTAPRVVPSYGAVLVEFDPAMKSEEAVRDAIAAALAGRAAAAGSRRGRRFLLPVAYGGAFGPDLAAVAQECGLTEHEVIQLHTENEYLVYCLGFSPGFAFLGQVPERLAVPRLATPRLRVPAGSVGLAGRQTGVYPSSTPGGWRLIGRTPIALRRDSADDPVLLHPGDRVRFQAIRPEDFEELTQAVASGRYRVTVEELAPDAAH